jgi:hypothetical protein
MGSLGTAVGGAFDKDPSMEQFAKFSKISRQERLAQKEVSAILDAQTAFASNALGQFTNVAAVDLYKNALGLIPQFEDTTPQTQELVSRRADLLSQRESASSAKAEIKRLKAEKKKAKGKEAKQAIQAQIKEQRKLTRKGFTKTINAQLNSIDQALVQFESLPKRITGFEQASPDDLPPDSPLSSKNPLNIAASLRNEQLIRALKGETEPSSRLVRQFAEVERRERERLRRQLGPDFENSSQGIEALGRLESNRAEAFEVERQKNIRDFTNLSFEAQKSQEASKAALLEAGAFLPTKAADLAATLSAPIQNTLSFLELQQKGREQETLQVPGSNLGSRIGGAAGAVAGTVAGGFVGGGFGGEALSGALAASTGKTTA